MSEYWISSPHFGTLTKANSTVVHAPRNVDLPVLQEPPKQGNKRKCLCLSFWFFGLIMLTAGSIVVAHFLIPEVSEFHKAESSLAIQKTTHSCTDLLPLEEKVRNSEFIVVGKVLPDMALEVGKIIKGNLQLQKYKLQLNKQESCYQKSSVVNQVFFLAPDRHGRSLARSSSSDLSEYYYLPKYQALKATPKIIQIVEKLVFDNGDLPMLNQEVQTTTESVCSKVDEEDCHQIDHCQLVSGPNNECTCQDPCQNSNNQDTMVLDTEPVCGSDHVTYRGSCQLKNAACGKHLNISQISDVPCEDAGLCGLNGCPFHGMCLRDTKLGKYKCQCPECYALDKPNYVCGNDGVTYQSLCHLHQASCLLQKHIAFDYDGQCKKCAKCPYDSTCYRGQCKCPKDCPSDYKPMCGTDGRTYNNDCWMMQQTCNNEKIVEIQSKGKCPHPSRSCHQMRSNEEICTCPQGVDSPKCDKCMPGFWAYTSFGCLDCGCAVMGSDKGLCDEYTGKCQCKSGFSGDKCEICPDGSKTLLDGCPNRSTKYYEPLSCGVRSCDFGATCIKSDCLCEFDCQNGDSYYKEPVCGNDGNTYRTECQLRQYSCRIQKEIIIVKYEPCTDAPRAVYGQDSRQQDILSDGTGTITVYGLIGDQCLDDRDCFIDSTSCIEGICTCESGYLPTGSNLTCLEHQQSLCDPNPCKGGGTCEEHDGTFSCYCPPGLAGANCQHDVSQTSMNIASFTGHSFIGLLTPDDVVNRFDIKISFRSFTENGIIFYAQGSKDNDFISLTILDGFVEFRYDLGSGTLLIQSNSKISMGQWHHLVARRYNQDGFLSLDASDKVTGKAVGSIKTLNVDQLAWIGGLDDDLKLDAREKAGTSSGFIGCMKDVELSRKVISIQSEHEPKIIKKKNLVECTQNPCSRMPCANGGSCEAFEQGYRCNCKPKFTGRQCQRPRDSCHPNPCQNHGQCIMDDLRGFICECKDGNTGRLCEKLLIGLNGKRIRKSLDHDGKEKVQFGLLINSKWSGKFMRAQLKNSENTLDIGLTESGELFIEFFKQSLVQPSYIVPQVWHKVTITKHHHKLSLKVDNHQEILHLDTSWPKISFSEKPLLFTDIAQGEVCLRNYHIQKWKHGRKSKTISNDICK